MTANPKDSAAGQGVVWIVDDGPDELELARRALEPAFSVRLFSDGSQLLEEIVNQPLPDVLVLDWMMPGISGVEVCRFLRAREATSELAILFLTAQYKKEQILEGFAAGANDYVVRPYAPAELVARVRVLVRTRRLRERGEAAHRSVRALLAHLPDALITTSATGEVTFLNAEAERILVARKPSVKGRHLGASFPELAKIHESPLDAEHFEVLPELEVGLGLYAPAVRRMAIDGVPMIAVTLRDVTEKHRLDLRRMDFYSMVAHDLRAPLAAMSLRVGLMREQPHGPLAEQYRQDLEILESRIAALVSLINDFLDIARSEGVGLALSRQPIDLIALVRENLAGLAESAGATEVTIRFDPGDSLIEAVADPVRINQVITNLISNAVKFSSKGGQVVVDVTRRELEVEFSVSDAGRGIAEDKISELFKRYSRPSSDSGMPGSGLGLMLVREIIAAHAGSCGVESALGKGSRFWFRIPVGAPLQEKL